MSDDMVAWPTGRTQVEQLALLIDSVIEYAIFLLDPSGHIRTWNAGAARMKGYAAAEVIGRHFSIFYTPADIARDHPAAELEIARREGRYEEEGWRLRKDGSRFWANVVITAVRDADGTLLGFGKVTRDLTRRRAAEQDLHEIQAQLQRSNQELDRFASVAAHDLSEPLRTVAGFAGLLRERHAADLPAQARDHLVLIASSVARMQRLIDDLLDYARAGGEPPPPAPVPVADAVEQVLGDLHGALEARRADVHVDVPRDAVVAAAPADVEMVLRNLVGNALKFTAVDQPRVTVTAHRTDGRVSVTVADNGIGIPDEQRDRIFAAFHRLHGESQYPGTGLGLAICHRAITRNGGAIGVDSTPGRGSRFWFCLPAAANGVSR